MASINDERKRAFARGFWRGLAAPAILFSSYTLPAEAQAPQFEPLPVRGRQTMDDDWKQVAQYLRAAVERANRG